MNIPLLGRIMAIIDVYTALTSERPYKQAFSPEEAVKIIMDSSGRQFDPIITEAFLSVKDKFEAVTGSGK
jgi:putative two-component system response regulator